LRRVPRHGGCGRRRDSIGLAYDDQIFNQATVSRAGGVDKSASDAASISAYGAHGYSATDLPLSLDSDAALVAQEIVDGFSTPRYRIEAISLNGAAQNRRTQICSVRSATRSGSSAAPTARPRTPTSSPGSSEERYLERWNEERRTLAAGIPTGDFHLITLAFKNLEEYIVRGVPIPEKLYALQFVETLERATHLLWRARAWSRTRAHSLAVASGTMCGLQQSGRDRCEPGTYFSWRWGPSLCSAPLPSARPMAIPDAR
jgi:hypothetical protein